jgi:hypothetical protein
MLVLTYAALATVEELFLYKSRGLKLEEFPGYTPDQWGIKAHNRPWIEDAGQFSVGEKIIEVGGAYSLLPKYLAERYCVEAWIGDDFGMDSDNEIWSRWGDPQQLPKKYPSVKYVFEPFGTFSTKYPERYFDCIYSVSTLEHIPRQHRLGVLKDMNRCLKSGGRQLHAIDISARSPKLIMAAAVIEKLPLLNRISRLYSGIISWIELIKASGVTINTSIPNPIQLLDRQILIESPDVIYRFIPPNDQPKPYRPTASLKLIIEDR